MAAGKTHAGKCQTRYHRHRHRHSHRHRQTQTQTRARTRHEHKQTCWHPTTQACHTRKQACMQGPHCCNMYACMCMCARACAREHARLCNIPNFIAHMNSDVPTNSRYSRPWQCARTNALLGAPTLGTSEHVQVRGCARSVAH
jgi:hypothetical protein